MTEDYIKTLTEDINRHMGKVVEHPYSNGVSDFYTVANFKITEKTKITDPFIFLKSQTTGNEMYISYPTLLTMLNGK